MHDVSQGDASDALVAVDDGVDEQGSFRVPDQKAPRRDSGEGFCVLLFECARLQRCTNDARV